MDGSLDSSEGLLEVERSFEWSRLSSQFVSLAYEQALARGQGESGLRSKADRERGECESIGMNHEWRWAAGG
jgi:hypothetical protein